MSGRPFISDPRAGSDRVVQLWAAGDGRKADHRQIQRFATLTGTRLRAKRIFVAIVNTAPDKDRYRGCSLIENDF